MRPLLAAALLAALPPAPAAAQERALVETARAVLAHVQPRSLAAGREICGLIVRAGDGFRAVRPRMGRMDRCTPKDAPEGAGEVVASFHTHGAFDAGMDSEVPSLDDLRADAAEGIVGFVATPGGRLWLVDGPGGAVRQICGIGCLPRDPAFRPGAAGPVRDRYDARGLRERARGLAGS